MSFFRKVIAKCQIIASQVYNRSFEASLRRKLENDNFSTIGVGYAAKRLDGLEARRQRMLALQRYDALAAVTRQQLTFECLWHLQSVLRCLEGEEKDQAKACVLHVLRDTPGVAQKNLTTNLKYRIWYAMFRVAPVMTAILRNYLKIGL